MAKKAAKRAPKKPAKKTAQKTAAGAAVLDPIVAPGSPAKYRVRVRMYRQGLGDCFLITFPRKGKPPFQMLIDCGVLARDKAFMTQIVSHIRDTVRNGKSGKARLDVVVATHEHKDHLSGFNQARQVFNDDFDFGSVWLGWTENLTKAEIKAIKTAKKKAIARLQAALASPRAALAQDAFAGVEALLGFSSDEDDTKSGKIADALEYLKVRGNDCNDLRYLEPGAEPFGLDGLDDVRVYVLGPPKDPILLKGSEVTEKMKKDDVIYHLSRAGDAGFEALSLALSSGPDGERGHPFSEEHRITRNSPYFAGTKAFVDETYDNARQEWRKIDRDWLNAFGQLALDLDNDTNNTSLVLAFEFPKTGEVLLFVGDAQVGNWQSWGSVNFTVTGRRQPLPAHDLLNRTVFYKVGHHCSHNATLQKGGLELMTRDDLVAFIPLDKATARNQGKHGWDMPAAPLLKALTARAGKRVVISDRTDAVSAEAKQAGVIETKTYIDYFLK
jgi:hypothetical protein